MRLLDFISLNSLQAAEFSFPASMATFAMSVASTNERWRLLTNRCIEAGTLNSAACDPSNGDHHWYGMVFITPFFNVSLPHIRQRFQKKSLYNSQLE
jgi:hypothetical protein